MKLTQLIKNKVVKNAGWIVFGRIIQMVINLIVSVLMARYLGPSNYGLVNYGIAYTSFFASIANLGINNVLVKEFIDHPNKEGEIIGTALFLRAVSSFLSAITIIGIVCMIDAGETTTIITVALCSLGLIFHIFEVIQYWFQSRLQSKVTAMIMLVAHMVTAIYKVVLMVNDMNVYYFAFATSLDYICIGILLVSAYKKHEGSPISVSLNYAKSLLKKSCHFILPGIMIAIYGQTDKIMLKQMVDVSQTGFYSTAVSLSNGWCFVLTAIIESMNPVIMKAYNTNHQLFKKRNKQLYAIIFYLSAFVAVMYHLLAEPAVSFLYGEEYMPVANILRVICLYTAFSYLGGARTSWIVCEQRQKYLVYIYGASALANVVMNLMLIPSFGALGAAVASLLTQIMTILVVPFFIKDLRENAIMMIDAILLKGIRGE